jgi:hypothetical protein
MPSPPAMVVSVVFSCEQEASERAAAPASIKREFFMAWELRENNRYG